ncbi:MAG: MerR family transcriptional regulator, partial [Acinetobacter sp.]|nr:MerR family transcriptional regulator [Acinetobacter sp.]
MLTIGKLAKQCQVNVETIRYYQRIGLMRIPETTQSYRYYNSQDIETLSFIQKAKDAGLQLSEIQELLQLQLE